ncbi:MAG: HAMP domain-containing protein [Proteobacteria bacterium]|nr:MAG: HAMP domain-containing protein [Pseudomonadota bacterium]
MVSRLSLVIGGSVRYKLLVLVLFPILLVMPVALGLAIYWGRDFTYDQLFIKVNTDLNVSHDVFLRKQRDFLDYLRALAESYTLRTAMRDQDVDAMRILLDDLVADRGLTYLHLRDASGELFIPRLSAGPAPLPVSSLFEDAVRGIPRAGVEIFTKAALTALSPSLAEAVRLPLIDTPRARPSGRRIEERGMMIRVVYPVRGDEGEVRAVLDGGVLLNNNFDFVDAIRELVYGPGSLPEGSIGTVTVFLEDVRISTNVPVREGQRALGTRVSDEVRTQVLDRGETWIDRAFVVNDWYISSYEPIVDARGLRVGMLYAGFLEAPFRTALWRALGILVILFFVLMFLSVLLAVRGAKSIFQPIEAMSAVIRATRTGVQSRVGTVRSRDEVGELAREFDSMLDLLQARNREIQSWADHLEDKVEERTAELKRKNLDLRRTISALRETRQQLVVAEKLAALGELTAGVAHEINNPAQVMLGNLEIIEQQLGDAAEPVRDEIRLVIDQIYRIQDIINNLLQYARPDQYAGYLTEVDVNELIIETLKLVRHLKKEKRFDVELVLDATIEVKISSHELQQVLVNLLVNAVHALRPRGGHIVVRSMNWEDKGVVLSVADDGVGMEPDELGRVFNPFYSTKGQGEGTGLGLSVSYGLVRRYGGIIKAESEPESGSRFTLWLLAEPDMITDEQTIAEQLRGIEDDARSMGL